MVAWRFLKPPVSRLWKTRTPSSSGYWLMRCMIDWYGTGEKKREQQDVMLGLIREHQDFWPHAVILAHIQKVCGRFPSR
ncbi:hypothetical protein Mame_01519 [Martelella mediterranea DSM 17316]|uniref:Uncharacterized protein n=1 Tax=Martelella mediterranea DSM 17316 TaxID=1122214 RepID=A0A1U9YZT2_9HYPH|nr:hypothetical protein Mame_01519 [Martelella mediterranea DSM 17316]